MVDNIIYWTLSTYLWIKKNCEICAKNRVI